MKDAYYYETQSKSTTPQVNFWFLNEKETGVETWNFFFAEKMIFDHAGAVAPNNFCK